MELKFRESFNKDINSLHDKKLKIKIRETIEFAAEATAIIDLKYLKKMRGHPGAYRIRLGDYRLGVFIKGNVIEFTRCLHSKEIYNYFP